MKHIKLLLLALAFSQAAFSQGRMSLEQVMDRVLENNTALQGHESMIKSQDAKVEGARAWMPPMLGAGRFMSPYPWKANVHDEQRGSWMFAAEQAILSPGKAKAAEAYLATRSSITRTEKGIYENELKSRVKNLFYDLVFAEKRLSFQNENLKIIEMMKKLAEIRYPYNKGSLGQAFKAEGRLYETRNMVLMTEAGIRSGKTTLNILMRRGSDSDLRVDSTLNLGYIFPAAQDTLNLSDLNRIRAMDLEIRSLALNSEKIRAEARPDLSLRYEHMFTGSTMMPNQYTLMAMIRIPLAPWSSRMQRSELRAMELEQEGIRLNKENMVLDIQGMTKSLVQEIKTREIILKNQRDKVIPVLKKNFDVTMLAYQENKESLPMVLDAWETVNMAQTVFLDQWREYINMIIEYEKYLEI